MIRFSTRVSFAFRCLFSLLFQGTIPQEVLHAISSSRPDATATATLAERKSAGQDYEKQEISIDYLSPFNEPGIYTKIPAHKIRELIRSNLGPLFRKAAVKTRIQVCDFGNRKDAWRELPVILADPQTRRYVGGIFYHGYEFEDQEKIAKIHDQYSRLPIWMTEVDHSYGTDTPRSKPLPRYDYEDGNFWRNQIISDLESGTSA